MIGYDWIATFSERDIPKTSLPQSSCKDSDIFGMLDNLFIVIFLNYLKHNGLNKQGNDYAGEDQHKVTDGVCHRVAHSRKRAVEIVLNRTERSHGVTASGHTAEGLRCGKFEDLASDEN